MGVGMRKNDRYGQKQDVSTSFFMILILEHEYIIHFKNVNVEKNRGIKSFCAVTEYPQLTIV